MFCSGCGHAIVLGPGGECVECGTPGHVDQGPRGPVLAHAGSTRWRRAGAMGALLAGGVLALGGGVALGISLVRVVAGAFS